MGAQMQGEAQGQMYQYQAGVAQINKQIEAQKADYARAVGETEAQESGMKSRFQIGQIRTALASSGLDINRGSAARVTESQQEVAEFDQALIRSNAAQRAYGYEVGAMKEEAQSTMYGMSASKAREAGQISMISSLLGTAGSVGSKWVQGRQAGLFAFGGTDSA
jgi:hypothetical protein